jgi:hypothetical protein
LIFFLTKNHSYSTYTVTFFIPIFTKKLREKMGRMEHYVWVALTAELDETLERLAREKAVKKATLVRMILKEYLRPYLEPQLSQSGPMGPGGSALRGAGLAGPETGGDEPQPFMREKAGGESG